MTWQDTPRNDIRDANSLAATMCFDYSIGQHGQYPPPKCLASNHPVSAITYFEQKKSPFIGAISYNNINLQNLEIS